MTEKKVGPSDFEAEVERLREAGKLPSLEQVLDAVAETRKKYAPKIFKAREQGPDRTTCRRSPLDSA